jgi:radical SAM/Cys-rich protein
MDESTVAEVLRVVRSGRIQVLDLTGGAPEMNPSFRELVQAARQQGVEVIDRCNLTILSEPGYGDLAEFLAAQRVQVVASLPCYLQENVDQQRGKGVYDGSLAGLRRLNALGYGKPETGLLLDLVYNPLGPYLPPPQQSLEADYRERLAQQAIVFSRLLTIANMPIRRFGSMLASKGQFDEYLALLKDAHQDANLASVMCRTLLSVDWQGYVYDCDFNQMLDMPLRQSGKRLHIAELDIDALDGRSIAVADHCFGCTAGQGSSCGGALG